jgi:hypothetical protein
MAAEPTSSWTMYLRQDGSQTEQKWVVCCCSIDVLSTAIGVLGEELVKALAFNTTVHVLVQEHQQGHTLYTNGSN